jgi:hypothetical protein
MLSIAIDCTTCGRRCNVKVEKLEPFQPPPIPKHRPKTYNKFPQRKLRKYVCDGTNVTLRPVE